MAALPFFRHHKFAQNESHLRNLILIAKSDNQITEPEIDCIIKIGVSLGFDVEEVKQLILTKEKIDIVIPESIHEKFEQLYDLTLVMMSDGVINDHEMEFCTGFANQLGFRKTISWILIINIIESIQNKTDKIKTYEDLKPIMMDSMRH